MNDVSPRQPKRPLFWPEIIFELKEFLAESSDEIYIVGGAVRDALLNRPLKDIDLATAGDGVKLARKIANRFSGDFFALDSERDVGRALVDTPEGRLMFDVARFRGADLLADLTDRDFTLNAMAVDLHGDLALLLDPLDGEGDIASHVVRRCTSYALSSDPIRALRAVRQSVQLGMRIEPETLADIRAVSGKLPETSPERVRDELFKLLSLQKPASALRIMDTVGLLRVILPEVDVLHGVQQSAPHAYDAWGHTLGVVENLSNILSVLDFKRSDNLTSSFSMGVMAVQLDGYRKQVRVHMDTQWPNERAHRSLLMLAALLHDVGKAPTASQDETGRWRFEDHEAVGAKIAGLTALNLRLSKAEQDRLVKIVQYHNRPLWMDDMSPRALHRFWRQLGEAGVDICLLSMADYLGSLGNRINQDEWLTFVGRIRILLEAYYDRRDQIVDPPVFLDGNQLMQILNLKQGRIIGELLDMIRESQAAGEIQSLEDALQFARAHLDKMDK
jgi:poly(A) polymerase